MLPCAVLLSLMPATASAEEGCENSLYPIVKDGKYGFIDARGSLVIKPRFDGCTFLNPENWELCVFQEGLTQVSLDGLWGYMDKRGVIVIPPRFDEASVFNDGLAVVGNKAGRSECLVYGLIDKTGKTILEPQFDFLGDYDPASGTFISSIKGKRGLVHKNGKILAKTQYDELRRLGPYLYLYKAPAKESEGWDSLYGFLDSNGSPLGKQSYADVRDFKAGLSAVMGTDGLWGLINEKGDVVAKPQFSSLGDFSEGLCVAERVTGTQLVEGDFGVNEDELVAVSITRFGYVDQSGKMAIEAKYLSAGMFSEGLAAVGTEDGRIAYIDKTGKTMLKTDYASASPFDRGLAVVRNDAGACGLIDGKGREILPPRYAAIEAFSEGFLKVGMSSASNGPFGLIDLEGRPILKAEYSSISGIMDNLAVVSQGSAKGLIDAGGKIVAGLKYQDFGTIGPTLTAFKRKGVWGYMDRAGREVIAPRFDTAGDFDGDRAVIGVKTDKGDSTGDSAFTYGFIDSSGKVLMQPAWDAVVLYDSAVTVSSRGRVGLADRAGTLIIKPSFDMMLGNFEEIVQVSLGDMIGYIDRTGKYIWPLSK